MLEARTIADLAVGDKASMTREITDADLALFAGATGDVNPIHFDREYAEGTFFKGRIAHGFLSAGLLSAVVANQLPGLGSVFISQNLRFLAPVRLGDEITAEVEVVGMEAARNRVQLATRCRNGQGTVVVEGEAVVMPPKRKLDGEAGDALARRTGDVRRGLAAATEAFAAALGGALPRS